MDSLVCSSPRLLVSDPSLVPAFEGSDGLVTVFDIDENRLSRIHRSGDGIGDSGGAAVIVVSIMSSLHNRESAVDGVHHE